MRAALTMLVACGQGWEVTEEEGLRHLAVTLQTDGSGRSAVAFDVLDGETAFAAVAQADPLRTNLPGLEGPSGALYTSDTEAVRLVTNAGFVSPVSVLAWPVLDEHGALQPGRYGLDVGSLAADQLVYEQGDVQLDVFLKSDPDFSAGGIDVRVVWSDGLEDRVDPTAMDAAFEVWTEIYAAHGLAVRRLEDAVWDGPTLGQPGATFASWLAMSSEGPTRVVNLALVEQIEDLPQAFGLAGGIPGPLGASGSSGVLVAYGLAAGTDGALSDAETRILGETLAHETGHYLGLFHPVEIGWDRWDSLGDTPECGDEADCEELFADNLMFPYPVCSIRDCTPQDVVTDAQGRGMNRHPLAD